MPLNARFIPYTFKVYAKAKILDIQSVLADIQTYLTENRAATVAGKARKIYTAVRIVNSDELQIHKATGAVTKKVTIANPR